MASVLVAASVAAPAAFASRQALGQSAAPSPAAPRVALTWSAPADCPSSAAVVAEVDRILGERVARPKAPLAVSARVSSAADGYRVDVQTAGADGPRSRSLRGKTCAAVADATALVIAVAIDPNAVPPEPRPVPPNTPDGPAPAAPSGPIGPAEPSSSGPIPSAPKPATAPSTDPDARPKTAPTPAIVAPAKPKAGTPGVVASYRLRAWGGLEGGALPAPTAVFGGEAGVVLASFRLVLGGEVFVSQQRVLATKPSEIGGRVGLAAGYLDVGYTFDVATRGAGDFELGPRVGLEIGSLHASSFGVTSTGSGKSPWEAPRVGGFGAWFPTRRFGLTLHAQAAFPFSRPTFVLEPTKEAVHQPSRASGRLDGGMELRF